MKLYPIVEGHGEVAAVPVLLRRLFSEAQCFVDVGRPIRHNRSLLRTSKGVQDVVQLARLQPDCAAIVILFDSDNECPVECAAEVRAWALEAALQTPCEVVAACREYETWFLAAIESLRGKFGISVDAIPPPTPESKRDAKGALEEFMPRHRAYSETINQPAMSAMFDLGLAHRRNHSFRKLVKAVGEILAKLGQPIPGEWPPFHWHPR